MLYGHISDEDGWRHLLANEAWRTVFAWLRGLPPSPGHGIVHLQDEAIWANVHGYETVSRDETRFESHRRYVDLQYCLGGGESIAWHRAGDLDPDGPYDAEGDIQFYRPAATGTTLQMAPGSWAVFHPSDAHAPRGSDGIHGAVEKLVVKVEARLL